MQKSNDEFNHGANTGPTPSDYAFIVFLLAVVVYVSWLGKLNYEQATKTELSKRNGEAWVEMLSKVAADRFESNDKFTACKGGVKSADSAGDETSAQGLWGNCFAELIATNELKSQINPFDGKPPQFIEKCIPTNMDMRGSIVLENLKPTPPGSATPFVIAQLVDTDPIDSKLQLRLSICDKGSDQVRIAEFEF